MNPKIPFLLCVIGACVASSYLKSSVACAEPVVADERDSANAERVKALRLVLKAALAQTSGELQLRGLKEVEVLRDRWGVPHIYAQNSDDLFFAQGFVQAQDRLWQMEIWRRTTEGKLAEIVGPEAFERDRIARLVRYRGDMDAEWTSYSPDARQIIESFVRGVNAFIELARDNPPIEFQLTGIKPEPWTPEVCLGRIAGFIMCRNASNEILRAQLVRELGAEPASKLLPIDPFHELHVPDHLNLDGIDQRIVSGINAVNAAIKVPLADSPHPRPLSSKGRGVCNAPAPLPEAPGECNSPSPRGGEGRGEGSSVGRALDPLPSALDSFDVGSNNWTIAGRLTTTGKPILASDPHRPLTLPSLRYLVHLNCPPDGKGDRSNLPERPEGCFAQIGPVPFSRRGWNVIGGTEPALPGVALGHNDRIAWGMTIVGTDQMDIYVEETHPDYPNRYRVQSSRHTPCAEAPAHGVCGLLCDDWQPMRIEREQIRVRGEPEPREIELKFTRHGPVIFEDDARNRAYALRWTGSEPGAAGYLAALSVDRAENWLEFLEAAARWKIPGLNLVYADRDGHIGWIAAALTPVRRNWDGLLPVPGAAGKFEWDGFLPTAELPQRFDPPEGYVATANHNILPSGYRHQISYEWAAPFRFHRIDDVLRAQIAAGRKFTIEDSQRLQHDATSIPAGLLLGILAETKGQPRELKSSIDLLTSWDGTFGRNSQYAVLRRDSAAAALYEVWQRIVTERVLKSRLPDKLWERYSGRVPIQVMIELMGTPDGQFGAAPLDGRDAVMLESLQAATAELQKRLGPDPAAWQWGKLHQAHLRHMLATPEEVEGRELRVESQKQESAERAVIAAVFNLPPVPRDGDAFTPLAAGGPRHGSFDQTTGASYRHVIDLADWDRSVATSTPGQSGQPTSPHYGDLLPLWAEGKYFPLPFSRRAVESATLQKLVLLPDDSRTR